MEQDKLIEKLGKWANYTKDPQSVVFDELDAISDKLEFIVNKLEPMDLNEAHTIEGDDGYSPVKGEDYFTDEELDAIKEEIIQEVTPVKGLHYFTTEEIDEIKNDIMPIKGVHYDDGINGKDGIAPTIAEIKADIIADLDFLDTFKGKDGETYVPESKSIIEAINSTKESINFDTIKGLSAKLMQQSSGDTKTIASKRIKVLIGGVEQSEPLGSINFASGVTHVGQDYTVTGGAGITAWTANTAYLANDVVYQGTNFYKRIASGTSGATFDATEEATWNVMGTTGTIAPWITGSYYEVGEVVINNNTIYRNTTAHTAGATFDVTEAANFTVIANYTTISAWTATTYYPVGVIVSQGTRILYRTTANVSAATFTNAEAANWGLISNEVVSTYASTTYYYAGERVSTVGKIVQRITSGISGVTFNATEAANWNLISSSLTTWTGSTYFYLNQRVLSPVTGAIMVGTGGMSSTTFDATEVTNLAWQLVTNSGNVIPFATSLYFFVGGLMSSGGAIYRRSIAGITGATLNAAELLNWTLVTGNPSTTVSANYTVTETDDMIDIVTGATYTITIPASRVNKIIKLSTASLSATPPTIATSGGETIVNPSTYASGTSFVMPGVTGSASSVQFQKVGTNWRFIA